MVTITFACLESAENDYHNLAQQFKADNPGVRVQIVALEPTSNLDAILQQVDASIIPVSPALTRQGLVRDLTSFMENDSAFQPEDFYTDTLESLAWDGGVWAVPFAVRMPVIFYDRAAFAAESPGAFGRPSSRRPPPD